MRKLCISVNEPILISNSPELDAGAVLYEEETAAESDHDMSPSLVGRAWPSTLVSGASISVEEYAISFIQATIGGTVTLHRADSAGGRHGVAAKLVLSPT
eukprot:CAMPEP_0113714604 /NCGR_PEP_ID=MMETSP0038_2-20120614/32719_1 /TAXON_ID=2898 /ORGANISM="Cryptomonas paramecium" /LENGTH=99 /DNA_ID=CAMNT_0000641619 /DNA_START=49 /DNA_END=345 /DNA_ORIENTATION=- /assembly_acc=CAM_ASM_000170